MERASVDLIAFLKMDRGWRFGKSFDWREAVVNWLLNDR
jgi:hypothetical protein